MINFRRALERLRKPKQGSKPHFAKVTFVASMDLVPEDPGSTIYIVGAKKLPKWAAFKCPCGQDHRLTVPLMTSVSPHWTLTVRRGSASLWPSVSVDNDPCTSHFWLRTNQVEWARWAWESPSGDKR